VKVFVAAENGKDIMQLYHERFGRQDKRHVKMLLEREMSIKIPAVKEICEPCTFGKANRKPFGSRKQVTSPGEQISMDVCEPFSTAFSKNR